MGRGDLRAVARNRRGLARAFASGAIDSARKQAGSAAAFGIIITPGNTRRHQVLAGRAYLRAQLTATALGVQMQPFIATSAAWRTS